jgi:tetratricopeptide (TPR) repeat protein
VTYEEQLRVWNVKDFRAFSGTGNKTFFVGFSARMVSYELCQKWFVLSLGLVLCWSTLCPGALADGDQSPPVATTDLTRPDFDDLQTWLQDQIATSLLNLTQSSKMQPPFYEHSPDYVMGLNNEGVGELKYNNFPEAIKDFEAALRIDPGYQMARDNLAIAHNWYGLSLRHTPAAALHEFHQALWFNPSNPVVQHDVEECIKMLHLDPEASVDRLQLAEHELSQFDLIGYLEESYISNWLKRHPGHDWKDGLTYSGFL